MNNTKRLLLILLTLAMLLPLIVACAKDEPNEVDGSDSKNDVVESSSDSESKSESESSEYDVYDDLGEIDMDGRTIVIAQPSVDDYVDEVDPDRLTGAVINDAVFRSNMAVEERLNIELKKTVIRGDGYALVTALESEYLGQQKTYDLILAESYILCTGITRGLYNDLKKVDNLDLSKVYWSPLLNDAYDIGGIQYVASGAVSNSFYRFMFVNVMNNRILNETKGEVPNVVQVVKDGKWTIEYQANLIKDYYLDKGAAGKDEDDVFGFVGDTITMLDAYLSSGEIQVLKKQDDGFYVYDFDHTRATAVMDDILELILQDAAWCYTDTKTASENEIKKFASGTALFASTRLVHLEGQEVKKMKDEYTILPVAKWSEDQTNYYSLISDRFTAMAIPSTVDGDDVHQLGAVMEAIASDRYRTVVPKYMENVLRTRLTSNPDNWEILKNMTENVKMDACLPYTAALTFSGYAKGTLVKLWRTAAYYAYIGNSQSIASLFPPQLSETIDQRLNGEDGLQTYIRTQLNT